MIFFPSVGIIGPNVLGDSSNPPTVAPKPPEKLSAPAEKTQAAKDRHNKSIKLAVTSEQTFLLHFLPEILKVAADRRELEDSKRVDGYIKRYHTIEKNQGELAKILNFFSRGSRVNLFSKVPNSILSSLLPDIKIFKVFHDRKTGEEFNWQIPFSDHVDINDISSIFQSRTGVIKNVVLRSISYDLVGTDFFTADKSIKAKLQITFDSIDKLLQEINVPVPPEKISTFGESQKFKFADLVMSNKEAFEDSPDPSFYKIRVVSGIKKPEPDILNQLDIIFNNFGVSREQFVYAIQESKIVLALNHVGHDLQFNEDGTIDFTLDYVAAIDSVYFDPLIDIFLINQSQNNLRKYIDKSIEINKDISKLKKCSDSSQLEDSDKKILKARIAAKEAEIDKNKLFIERESVALKSSFLSTLYDEQVTYEIDSGTEFKSVLQQIADSKTKDTIDIEAAILNKAKVKPENIKKITGGGESLKKLRDLYKKLQDLETKRTDQIALAAQQKKKALEEYNKNKSIIQVVEKVRKDAEKEQGVYGFAIRSTYKVLEKAVGFEAFQRGKISFGEAIDFEFADALGKKKYEDALKAADEAIKKADANVKKLEEQIQGDLSKTIDFSSSKIKFILLGDLLNVALKALDNRSDYIKNFDVPTFILGLSSMIFANLPDNRRKEITSSSVNKTGYTNIYSLHGDSGEIENFIEILYGMENFPISVNRLTIFLVEKISKRDVQNYPLFLFLKDIMQLAHECTIEATSKKARSYLKLDMEQAKLFISETDFNNIQKENYLKVIDTSRVDSNYLKQDPEAVIKNNEKFVGVTYFYSRGFSPGFVGKFKSKDEQVDQKVDPRTNSIFEIVVGSKTGILKKISYTKANQPGFLEARMRAANEMADGNDGYALRMKYHADVTLYGPSIFRPGDYLELSPSVLSTLTSDASQLLVDQLGLGGFYNVEKASTTISETVFETKIKASFVNYKNGQVRPSVIPNNETLVECLKATISAAEDLGK